MKDVRLHRGRIWRVGRDPETDRIRLEEFAPGGLAVDGTGRVVACGDLDGVRAGFPEAEVIDHGEGIVLPGFVDAHTHFPQRGVIGAMGESLLGWLNRHVYAAERAFVDAEHAGRAAARLVETLLANGITSAAILGSVHREATERLFAEAGRRGLRAVIGKMSMDRNAPAELCVPAERDAEDSRALIERWHGRGRLAYALTPRFAPACSEGLLAMLGGLRAAYPGVFVQTHWAESRDEIRWVRELFPGCGDYLEVYERSGLIGPRTLLAHGIHPSGDEARRVAAAGATVVHCPSANRFLGSGAIDLAAWRAAGVRVALGSDVGAGTTYAPWRLMLAAYEIQRGRGTDLAPAQLLWLATGAPAAALGMAAANVPPLMPGAPADLQIVLPERVPLLAERLETCRTPDERLGVMIALADERVTARVYISGEPVWPTAP